MALRKNVFIDEQRWELFDHDGVEFEQYDTFGYAHYVIAHTGDRVLAGCRLIRCDKVLGSPETGSGYTYMIKDAVDGRISLPQDICWDAPPVSEDHWELTRMVALPGNRQAVLRMMRETYNFLSSAGAVGCLCLASPVVNRLARISGFETVPLGPISGNEDGRFSVFKVKISVRGN